MDFPRWIWAPKNIFVAVGEKFHVGGKAPVFVAVDVTGTDDARSCARCAFRRDGPKTLRYCDWFSCASEGRADRREVIFRLLDRTDSERG